MGWGETISKITTLLHLEFTVSLFTCLLL